MPSLRQVLVSTAVASLVVASVWWTGPAAAASRTFDVTLKGVSKTVGGDRFKYTGEGTMSIDDVSGTFDYDIQLSNGLTFSGSGNAAVTEKNEVFAVATTTSGGISGSVVFVGKLKGSKFKGKLTAAVPNRIGPPPAGFVLSTAKISGSESVGKR